MKVYEVGRKNWFASIASFARIASGLNDEKKNTTRHYKSPLPPRYLSSPNMYRKRQPFSPPTNDNKYSFSYSSTRVVRIYSTNE